MAGRQVIYGCGVLPLVVVGMANCQAMGHHHPHVNHSLWQPPHAQGLALIGVVKARIEIAATLLCEKCNGLLARNARIVITVGRRLTPSL